MVYKLKYARSVKIISAIVIVALGAVLYLYTSNTEQHPIFRGFICLSLGLMLLYPLITMPISIRRTDQGLILKRLCWTSYYKSSDYEISENSPKQLEVSIRIFGTGGYLGYRGYFYNGREGIFKLTQTGVQTRYFRLRRHGKKRYHYIAYA